MGYERIVVLGLENFVGLVECLVDVARFGYGLALFFAQGFRLLLVADRRV